MYLLFIKKISKFSDSRFDAQKRQLSKEIKSVRNVLTLERYISIHYDVVHGLPKTSKLEYINV